jgi:DNA-binding NarL/FixJ family response regulator
MDARLPYRVAVMDNDPLALPKIVELIYTDKRTTVCAHGLSPADLLTALEESHARPDAFVVDTEYRSPDRPLGIFLPEIRRRAPAAVVICLSQFGDAHVVRAAVSAGIEGFILKDQVWLALSTAVVRACQGEFTYSPGVEEPLHGALGRLPGNACRMRRWRPHPDIGSSHMQVFWLCFVHGMSAPMAAEELHLTRSTVETYKTKIIGVLADGYYDERYLGDVAEQMVEQRWDPKHQVTKTFRGALWAFHMLTQPPRPDIR